MCFGAQQHAANEVGGGNARRTLDDLEATGLFDESVAVVSITVRGYVISMDDILAAVMCDVRQLRDIWCVANGLGDPAAGVCSC